MFPKLHDSKKPVSKWHNVTTRQKVTPKKEKLSPLDKKKDEKLVEKTKDLETEARERRSALQAANINISLLTKYMSNPWKKHLRREYQEELIAWQEYLDQLQKTGDEDDLPAPPSRPRC